MGIDAMRISAKVRDFVVVSVRICYRSVCKHPFLVGMVCFLIFMYRSFPLLFSLLVSASPVLVCAAMLLGTLLSFGEPNIPEIEKDTEKEEEQEEEVNHEISYLKAAHVEDAAVIVDRDGSSCVERFFERRGDVEEKAIKEESLAVNGISKSEDDDGLGDEMPPADERSRGIQFEKQVTENVKRDFDEFELEKKREIHHEKPRIEVLLRQEEAVGNQRSSFQNVVDQNLEVKDGFSAGESAPAQKGDHLYFSHDSSWKGVNDNEEVEEASDSGSSGAESSSPDASMADIISMLDELHPLLDEEAPQPAHMFHDRSDTGSERSHKSKESSLESLADMENQADEEEDGDDDNENEEESQGCKEDDSKSAIKWTADDEKNLVDLGTSELERNQRLESHIARRRACRSLRLMAEKNLIDFDAAAIPINIPPISTLRHNPFDLPFDDVPGSAPSVLLPRRNPFDLPYDANEEKPDLKGDGFQQEFSAPQHREAFFRRHESFNVGPSVFGGKQERQDLRWKPYFVPERFATEGASYPTFQRQLSEVSESKMSSVPDTESVNSTLAEEDKKLNEDDVYQETEQLSNLDHVSLLVERGSLSSEDVNFARDEQVEKSNVHGDGVEITLGDVESHHDEDSALPVEGNTSEILLRMGPGEEEYSSRSSLSSLSEVDEKIPDVQRGLTILEATSSQPEESHSLDQNSLDPDFHFVTGVADEGQNKEPVLEQGVDHIGASVILMQTSIDSDFHFTSAVTDENENNKPTLEPADEHPGDAGILKQASLLSDLNIMNGVAVDERKPIVEPSHDHIGESDFLMQNSLQSDFPFTSGAADDDHQTEPLYDSSPPSAGKFFSFTSISSDTQIEISQMGSPIALEMTESELCAENRDMDTAGYEEMLEGSSQVLSSHANESEPWEVTETSVRNATGVDSNFDENGFMSPESFVPWISLDLPPSSSDSRSLKEDMASNFESAHHEQAQLHQDEMRSHRDVIEKLDSTSFSYRLGSEETNLLVVEEQLPPVVEEASGGHKLLDCNAEPVKEHADGMEEHLELEQDNFHSSSFDTDIYINGSQAVGEKLDLMVSGSECMPSNDIDLPTHDQRHPAVRTDQNSEALSFPKTKNVGGHLLKNKETFLFEQDEVHSSCDDASDTALNQDVDMANVSSCSNLQHVPSDEKPPFELEKRMSYSDKCTVDPSLDIHNEAWESSIIPAGSAEEGRIANNVNVLEACDSEDKIKRIHCLRSDLASVSSASSEYKTPACGEDLKDIFDKVGHEDSYLVFECSNYSEEAYGSSIVEENISDKEAEMKEIDEGLLSELDTVGDFSVKDIVGESLRDDQIPETTRVGSSEIYFLHND